MLDKLKIAAVLLIIGTMSGLMIWGTHTVTRDRIEENRIRKQYETFVVIFPDMDVSIIDDHRDEVEHSLITEIITVYDRVGQKLGYLYIGSGTNTRGYIDLVIGVDTNFKVIKITTSSFSQSPGYLEGMRDAGYFEYFSDQALSELDYKADAYSGSTQTHDLIKAIIESAKLLVAGDPVLEALKDAHPDVERYEHFTRHFETGFDEELILYDAQSVIVGFAFVGDIDHQGTEYRVAVVTDADDVFKGFAALEDDVPASLTTALEAFAGHVDTVLEAIELGEDLDAALETFFLNAQQLVETSERIIGVSRLSRFSGIYDGDDLIGYVYRGSIRGHNGQLYVDVAIGLDDVIDVVEIVHHVESSGYFKDVTDHLDDYMGLDDPEDYDTDVYTGSTVSGDAVYNVVKAAHDYHTERNGD